VPISGHRHDIEDARREQLLAVQALRRDLEHQPLQAVDARRWTVAVTRAELAHELRELIAALDRRVPHVERAGEASIASDAAALRAKAMRRLAELEAEERSRSATAESANPS
jgi:hypothetical protein